MNAPLENESLQGKIPRFTFEYVQAQFIKNSVEKWSETMKKYFNHANEEFLYYQGKFEYKSSDKYNSSIYYISPFYHKIFPKLSKIVAIDVDMEFQVEPAELYQEFEKFDMEQIIGSANDLQPHYSSILENTG